MKQIRESKFSKIVAYYLILMMILQVIQPMQMYALTGGPTQPEFNSFTPIGTSDMVDLASGDFNYNIPIMDVGGYPLNLAYNSGVTMDQEASWTGLGWDLGVGQIARQVRGIPDDFNGDQMIYENNMKKNTTIGSNFNVFLAPFGVAEGVKASVGFGVGIKYNSYDGFGCSTNAGLTFAIGDNLNVGMQLENSSTDGVSASPSISLSAKTKEKEGKNTDLSVSAGVSMNSRKGVESVTMSASARRITEKTIDAKVDGRGSSGNGYGGSIGGGSLSFAPADFTPSKRVGMSSVNAMFNLNVEGAVYGVDPGFKFSGYRNSQGIKSSEKFKIEKAFGYENTPNAGLSDILDFNREKDRTVNRNTVSLPVTNYTYDLYNIQGQGVGGMFRPYRSQVGYVYDNFTQDDSVSLNIGVELGAGAGAHVGVDLDGTKSKSYTGLWEDNNPALSRFNENETGNKPNYEKVLFKNIGGAHVDKDMIRLLNNELGGYEPISFKLTDNAKFHRNTSLQYYKNVFDDASVVNLGSQPYIKRGNNRLNRNQVIQKISREEAGKFGSKTFSPYSKKSNKNHTAEVRIIKDGGEQYNYGRAAYNSVKREVTFDVSSRTGDCKTGLVQYNPGRDNSSGNDNKGDQYFNRITTPAYAHSYLLTSVLSSDYQDTDKEKGPSDGDLGTYTKFSYTNKSVSSDGVKTPYKWRVPYKQNSANYDEGLRSSVKDNKGSYQYGEKELLYINKIETKTHVAIFTISERKDGHGVIDENGGGATSEASKMWKLDKISLYSKPEYLAHKDDLENAVPIKVAHFEYNYSLCKGIENNIDFINKTSGLANTEGGKLTLKKVYFTYRNSNMGKYTPYTFNYEVKIDPNNPPVGDPNHIDYGRINPDYNQKDYDIWGNYKKSNEGVGCGTLSALSNAEYPFVQQGNQVQADQDASVWLLRSIGLPSGGEMELNYESDDYKYVQNKEAMQMFKVVGAGTKNNPVVADVNNPNGLNDNTSYGSLGNFNNPLDISNDYLYIKLDKPCLTNQEFHNRYIRKLIGLPIYFRFLTNMTSPFVSDPDKYDYVTGYLNLSNNIDDHVLIGTNYAAVRINNTTRGDGAGVLSTTKVSPITKAGWYFGRQYLNNTVYSHTGREDVDIEDVEGVVKSLVGMITDLKDIVISPNHKLIDSKIASKFIANKSWIRLMQPESKKLGGGVRVKEIKIHDNWDRMTDNDGQEVYKQFYGQQYSYLDKDGNGSSGVASYEPLGCKENPFVYPFYDHNKPDSVLGPGTQNYVELPFGECFFPSPKITYSHVSVKNLAREKTNANEVITLKKHATGDVVTDFFTTRDYPTISDISMISAKYDNSPLAGLLNIDVKTHLTMAQGFSIHTNDMDGKMKSQEVYSEGKELVSGMEYKYEEMADNSTSNQGKLNNEIVTIDSNGVIGKNTVAVDYDVVNDFRENFSETKSAGLHFQTETLPITLLILVVPCPIPRFAKHVNMLRTAITTKVIHSTGILRETIAFDKNAKVSTKNLAWDADTGNVLLTETVNEYNDKYYNFNFPAYWSNPGMSQAALNLGLTWNIKNISGQNKYQFDSVNSVNPNADDYLIDGDEVWATPSSPNDKRGVAFKAWVVNVKQSNHSFDLIDEKGIKVVQQTDDVKNPNAKVIASGSIKVIKSGHKNMQGASMASVTLMKKPSLTIGSNIGNDPFLSNDWSSNRIVNASAIEYKDVWPSQCECGLPQMKFKIDNLETPLVDESKELSFQYDLNNSSLDFDIIEKKSYNPYRYNVLGNWRAVKSHAYLTGRNNTADPTPRKTGFFNDFRSFYVHYPANKNWTVTTGEARGRWTFASEVSQYNAWGQEVENKDALERYSSALYGYNNRFPVAVASNTKYKELAYDGFEDYDFADCNEKSHFSYEGALVKNKISITNKQSHTGRRSIRLEPKATSTIQKKIVNCTPTTTAKTNTKIVAKK